MKPTKVNKKIDHNDFQKKMFIPKQKENMFKEPQYFDIKMV